VFCRDSVGGNPSVTFQESSACATLSMKSNLNYQLSTTLRTLMICPNSIVPAAASVHRLVVARIIREIGGEGTVNISPEATVAEVVGVGRSRYVLVPLFMAARRSSLS